MKFADWLIVGFSAAWLIALLVVITDGQQYVRVALGSEVTATWAGALATVAAVWSGFRLARQQQDRQFADRQSQERSAIGSQIRAAAMLVKGAHTQAAGYMTASRKSAQPREFAAWSEVRDYTRPARLALEAINVAAISVPVAIDCVMGARGQQALFQVALHQLGAGELDHEEFLVRGEKIERALWAQFLSLVKLAEHYDPIWRSPDYDPVDPDNPPVMPTSTARRSGG